MAEEITTLLPLTPTALLGVIADALNQLVDLGERVDVRFGAIMTNYGYVLPNSDGSWSAKLKLGGAPEWWGGESPTDPGDE